MKKNICETNFIQELKTLRDDGFITHEQIVNYWPRLRLKQLNYDYPHLLNFSKEALNSMGFERRGNTLGLIPVDVNRYIAFLGGKLTNHLIHNGFISNTHILVEEEIRDQISPFDNRANLALKNIWGNPDPRVATFLKPPDSRVVPMARNGHGSRLYVDLAQLQSQRRVYVDPEMYIPQKVKNFDGAEFDCPPNSLMVFGGIPAGAIKQIEPIFIQELK